MKPILRVAIFLAVAGTGAVVAQSPARHQPRPEHDLRSYGIVDSLPGAGDVRVAPDVTYKTAGGRTLQMSVYYPPKKAAAGELLPVVVFVNGVGDRPDTMKVREWGQYRSWPRLVAASGLAAATFDARGGDDNAADVRDAFAYVQAHGKELGLDPSRIAAWACSANVRVALALLMAETSPSVRGAVFYYGASDDATVRPDLPVLMVRAGRDRPQQNAQIDRIAGAAAAANAPWTVMNVPMGHHAFDILDDNDESRSAIRKTVAFLHDRLDPAPAPPNPPVEARVALAHFFAGEWAEAETAYAAYVARHPDDVDALVLLSNARVELKKFDDAQASLKKAIAMDPTVGEAWAMLGRIEADKKNYDAAIENLDKAIALMPDDAESHFQLGKARLAKHDAAAAIASLTRAVELNPGNGWAWNSLAYAYMEAKQPAKAAESFEHVLPFAPKNPGLLYNTACAYALAGNAGKALDLLDRAVAEGYKDKPGMIADPDLGSVRADPRFVEILKRLS